MEILKKHCDIIVDIVTTGSDQDIQAAAVELVGKVSKHAAYVLKRVFSDPGTVGPQLAKCLRKADEDALVEKYTVDSRKRKLPKLSDAELLYATIELPLGRVGFNKWKKLTDSKCSGFVSNWNYMNREKKLILPNSVIESDMEVSDTVCSMPLFTMLESTVTRLFEVDRIKVKIDSLVEQVGANATNPLDLRFFYKVGCDGTGGMSQYHQNCSDGSSVEDNKLFGNCPSFVMIRAVVYQ